MIVEFSFYVNIYYDDIEITTEETPIEVYGSIDFEYSSGRPETGDYDPGYIKFKTFNVDFFGYPVSDKTVNVIEKKLENKIGDILAMSE